MRYLVAMIFAVIGAALAALFVSPQVADWVAAHQSFNSSDDAENMNMLVYVGSNVLGLLVGWLVGWTIIGSGRAGKQPT